MDPIKKYPIQRADRITVLLLLLGMALALCGSSPALAAAGDAGSWQALPLFGGDVRAIAIHPEDPDRIFAGTSAGQLWLSRDAGRTWAPAGAPLPFPGWVVSALRFDPNHPTRLWVALWG